MIGITTLHRSQKDLPSVSSAKLESPKQSDQATIPQKELILLYDLKIKLLISVNPLDGLLSRIIRIIMALAPANMMIVTTIGAMIQRASPLARDVSYAWKRPWDRELTILIELKS